MSLPQFDQPVDAGRLGVKEVRNSPLLIHIRKVKTEVADLAGVGRRFLSELEAGKPTLEIGKVLLVLTAAGIELVARDR